MFVRRSTRLATGLAGVILIAACGGSADDVAAPPAEAELPAVSVSATSEDSLDSSATDAPAPIDTAAVEVPPTGETPTATEPPATEPASTEAPAAAPLGGRALAAELDPAAAFDGNPLPDLVVDDLGRQTQANLANLLPSDRPVLLWAWAPH
jgi:hypothetical protein